MTLSKLFLAAIKYLSEEEFLCIAINEAFKVAVQGKDEDEIRRLYALRG